MEDFQESFFLCRLNKIYFPVYYYFFRYSHRSELEGSFYIFVLVFKKFILIIIYINYDQEITFRGKQEINRIKQNIDQNKHLKMYFPEFK